MTLHRYLPELAGQTVPRYTSYPTAAEFRPDVGAAEQTGALAAIAPDAPISLYLHVPYCQAICWYCGCSTGAVGRPERLDVYLTALEQEIDFVAARMRGRVTAVHFGGGSPNALAPDQLRRLVRRLRRAFAVDAETRWAIELDPRLLDPAQAEAIAESGFSRVSLGVQTFALPVQAAVNRLQPFRAIAAGVTALRAAGVRHINFDLMYGLPRQSLDDIAATVTQARSLRPDRIAMFGYAHLPAMLPRQRMIDTAALPEAKERFWQSALAHDLLLEDGYETIGFDHFALPADSLAHASRTGTLRRNFQGFTDDAARILIGLGASAISRFDDMIVQNEKHVGRYRLRVANGALAGARGVAITSEDRMRGAAIEQFLCDGSIDIAAVVRAHGREPGAFVESLPRLEELASLGVISLTGWRVRLASWARPYARLVAASFDAYRADAQARFSRAV